MNHWLKCTFFKSGGHGPSGALAALMAPAAPMALLSRVCIQRYVALTVWKTFTTSSGNIKGMCLLF